MKENFYTNTQGEQIEYKIEKIAREIKIAYGERIVIKSKVILVEARNKKKVWALDQIEDKYKSEVIITRRRDGTVLLIEEIP